MSEDRSLQSALAAIRQWEPDVQALVGWTGSPLRPAVEATDAGPLAGWPVAVKDIIDVAGVPTAFNAPFIPARPAPRSAAIVERLEACGAQIVAKSVTTTFAYYDPGPTRNPWELNHTPGGSSSGSAAAVACGMVRLALGSQTVGSINRPASFCGVVGLKPTYGALPMEGVFPFAPSVDTLGFFTRNTGDAHLAFTALSGTPVSQLPSEPRFAVVDNLLCAAADPDMSEAVDRVAQTLSTEGRNVGRISLPESLRPAHEHHAALTAAEAAESHRQLFGQYGAHYPPRLRQLIERGRSVTAEALARIEAHRTTAKEVLNDYFNSWDVLITPSAPGQATRGLDSTGDPRMSLIWTYAGLPTLTVPASLGTEGLPMGVQLTAAPGRDAELLAAGSLVEQAIGFRETSGRPSNVL